MPTTIKISIEISLASSPDHPDQREAELVSLGKEIAGLHGATLTREQLIALAQKWADELARNLQRNDWIAELGRDFRSLQSPVP